MGTTAEEQGVGAAVHPSYPTASTPLGNDPAPHSRDDHPVDKSLVPVALPRAPNTTAL